MPLEAMAAGRAVVAVDDGDLKETVKHGATGWLCAAEPAAFAAAFASVAAKEKSGELRRMGEAARAHVTKASRSTHSARSSRATSSPSRGTSNEDVKFLRPGA